MSVLVLSDKGIEGEPEKLGSLIVPVPESSLTKERGSGGRLVHSGHMYTCMHCLCVHCIVCVLTERFCKGRGV